MGCNMIGILTFINTVNYGAELQAYALARAIESLGYEAEIVNYECPEVSSRELPENLGIGEVVNFKRFVKSKIDDRIKVARSAAFRKFRDGYVKLGAPVLSASDLSELYTTVVVGSDQVWNPALVKSDTTYLLGGIPQEKMPRIAYAASFGDQQFPIELEETYRNALSLFASIGVREESGLRLVESWLGHRKEFACVLDPTLLLSRDDWAGVAVDPEIDNYVFAYAVRNKEGVLEAALEEAAKRDVEVIMVECYGHKPRIVRGVSFRNKISPAEFLGYIQHSSCVVTSSFHGFAFATIFGKSVRVVTAKGVRSERIESLAKKLQIGDRGLSEVVGNGKTMLIEDQAMIALQKKRSIAFLADSLDLAMKGR